MSKHKRVELGAVVLLAGVVTALAGCGLTGASHAASSAPPSSESLAESPSATHHAAKRHHAGRSPAATVRAYFTAINNQDYTRAWHLGGRYTGSSYSAFVSGFQGTAHDIVTILSVSGNVVTARLAARQTDRSVRTYQGTYRVSHGVITRFHVAQVGSSSGNSAAHRSGCGAALWGHIYHPDRLHVVHQCMTVRGTVQELRWEADGDLHILLATRPGLVNSANDEYEHGDLVLEEICQGRVTQADAVAACQDVPRRPAIPSVGDKVTVTGSYVLDADHGWMEIHPVTSLTVTGSAPVQPAPSPTTAAPGGGGGGCHPKTSSGNCYEPGEFCPHADAGMTGVAGDGKAITCELVGGYYRWED